MSDATLMQITCRVNASHALRVAGCLQMSSFSRRKQSPDSSPPQEVLPLWSSTSQEIVSWLLFLDGFFYILLISPAYTVFLFYSWCPVIFFLSSYRLSSAGSSSSELSIALSIRTLLSLDRGRQGWMSASTLQTLQSGCFVYKSDKFIH